MVQILAVVLVWVLVLSILLGARTASGLVEASLTASAHMTKFVAQIIHRSKLGPAGGALSLLVEHLLWELHIYGHDLANLLKCFGLTAVGFPHCCGGSINANELFTFGSHKFY